MDLGLSILAIVLSVGSLAWQAYTWRRTGARPRLEGLVFQTGDEEPVMRLEVRNTGRAPCQLVKLQLADTSGVGGLDLTQYFLPEQQTTPPTQIAGGSRVVYDYDASAISRAANHHVGSLWTCKVMADFGDGTRQMSQGTLTFNEPDFVKREEPSARGDEEAEHYTVRMRIITTTARYRRPATVVRKLGRLID